MTKFIDFNTLPAGTIVDNEFSTQGVTVSATGGANKAMVFNTAHPTGGDDDLASTNLGGALIISEDGDSHDPDDNAHGGTFTFDFDTPADVNRLTFLDIEEGATVKFFAPNGHLIKSVDVHATDNNGQLIQDFDVAGVASMEVELNGSGAIDNLVFDDSGLDGVVEGDNDANLIDAAYDEDPEGDCIDANDQVLPGEDRDDDIVDALGGDDTVKSGKADDEVYAGSGDDSVQGGAGDDVIFGDSNYDGPNAGTSTREVFEWEKSPFGDDNALGNFTQDTGNVDVSFTVVQQSGASTTIQSDDDQNVANIDGDGDRIDDNSSLDNVLNGNGNSADYKLDFSAPVEDVSFRVNDIDGDGVVRIKAFDANGAAIIVNLEGGSRLTLSDTDGVAGNDTADSNEGYLEDTDPEYSLLVSIPGPVSRIEIEHSQNGGDNSGINITDVYFDAPIVDDGLPGNDTLAGDDGDDTIFGEEGDDLLRGGNDDDVLVGGDGSDRLEGGNGNDLLDGGADRDILLGGAGDDTGFGGDDNDEIWMGSGDDVANGGADNDWIHGQSGDDMLDGGAGDDMVFGENNDDTLSGGSGDDTVEGGTGDDLIFGDETVVNTTGGPITITIDGDGASFTNEVFAYSIDPATGDISNIVTLTTDHEASVGESFTYDVAPGTVVGVGIVSPQGTFFSSGFGPNVGLNPDGILHTAGVAQGPEGQVSLGFEDILNGGDNDFNDVLLTVDLGNSGATFDNAHFDYTSTATDVDDGPEGDDLLVGGEGDDTIFGNGGNDEIIGGAGADQLSGDADADTIFAGAGDVVDGGSGGFDTDDALNTDLDVLDLTGQGPFFLDNVTTDSNGNGINGTVVFVDGGGNPNGLTLTFSEIEQVVGDEINRGPDAVDDSATASEDGPAIDIDLTGNDTDPDAGDDLEIQSIDTTGTLGSVTINPDDDSVTYDADGAFENLAVGETATDTFTYTVDDGNGGTDTATVTVTINGENDGPTAVDDTATTPFDTAVEIDVLSNDTDPDTSDVLRVTNASSPNGAVAITATGMLLFTPTPGFEGAATIDYDITDDNGGISSAQVTVTVEPQPLDGIVSNGDEGALIDVDYMDDPEGDRVDNNDELLPGEGPNDDIIEAGGGNDTILAGEGDDDVFGGTGDDQIHGDVGNDILRGEAGDDTINGGAGDDTILGGIGDDEIQGGDGSDSIEGGDGDDLITSSDPDNDLRIDKGFPGLFTGEEGTPEAENERDFVDGGAGDDTIRTGDDRDTIVGGTGDDVIDGGIDDDEITGDEGADRIVGGEGEDTILGGIGNDTIFAGNDPVLGLDALNIEDDGSNPFGPDLRPDNGRDFVDGGEGDDLIFGADDDDTLIGGSGNDTIDGEIDDDSIDGGIGNDSLLGGQGNDTINGGEGSDFIDGGRNADVLNGGDGNDTIFGDNGADVIDGGAGDDVIDGGTGDDTLSGGAGDDDITGSTGDDVIDGGDGADTIDGGNGGSDIMSGGADEDLFINVDAGEVVDGNEEVTTGVDFDTLDLTGSAPNNGSLNIVFDPTNSENGVVNYFDSNGDAAGSLTFSNIENVIPCFTPGTLIATPQGERAVETLGVGDRVITRDNGIQEIRWVGQREMSGAELTVATHLRPVLIRKGALGAGLPERDMLVSPQHRVLMANDKTALYFDETEVLVAAKHLTGMEGIDVVDVSGTTYIHVMFDQHEVILSDGAWTESFQPGDQTLASMGDAQRTEILELFPELETEAGVEAYTAARRSLKKHEAQLLT